MGKDSKIRLAAKGISIILIIITYLLYGAYLQDNDAITAYTSDDGYFFILLAVFFIGTVSLLENYVGLHKKIWYIIPVNLIFIYLIFCFINNIFQILPEYPQYIFNGRLYIFIFLLIILFHISKIMYYFYKRFR